MEPVSLTRTVNQNLSPSARNALKALTTQQAILDYPYYSSVCFRADVESEDTTSNQIYVFHRGEVRRAFAYGRGESGVQAGFTDAIDGMMTLAETNLIKKSETIGGQQIQIDGIAIMVKPGMTDGMRFSQARLLAQIATNVSIQMSLNADQNLFALGTLQQIPAAGGLVGPGNDDLSFVPLLYEKATPVGAVGDAFSFGQNGWQTRGNYYRFPNGLIWNPAGLHDSMLNVVFTVERDFTLYTGGTPDHPQTFTSGGETPTIYTPETIGATLLVQLVGQVVGPRTRSA